MELVVSFYSRTTYPHHEDVDAVTEGAAGARVKHADIPPELRRAFYECARLRSEGEPIPDHVRQMANEYRRWANNGGKDPGGRTWGAVYTYIPEELRKAVTRCAKARRAGLRPSAEDLAKQSEYWRWRLHGGPPPQPDPPPEWPKSAHLEWRRLIRAGTAPGDIDPDIARGHAEYEGRKPHRYTRCAPSDRIGGRACHGRHGNGPRRLPYAPGVANCRMCNVAYTDVPDDVFRCGCCGGLLRKEAKFK